MIEENIARKPTDTVLTSENKSRYFKIICHFRGLSIEQCSNEYYLQYDLSEDVLFINEKLTSVRRNQMFKLD